MGPCLHSSQMGFSPSSPYPYIAVNDDDDDENGRMDNHNQDPDGPLVNGLADDDLVPLLISVDSPVAFPDEVTLGVNQDPGGLQVWEEPNRAGPIVMGWPDYAHTWPAGSWSKTVYVEGMHASGTVGPLLTWYYFGGSGRDNLLGWNAEAPSHKRWTVVHVDMDMPTVADDWTQGGDVMTEETTPGGFIPLDGWAELTVRPVMPDSLSREVSFSITNNGDGRIEVWNAGKTQQMTSPFSPTANTTCWVKGTHVSSSLRDITLCLTHTQTGFQDKIKLTVSGIKSVDFEKYMDNTDLDANPNQGGGKRIFPDKQTYADESPDRQKVRVVATYIGPVLENRHVYFKSFDVDDPSTSTIIDPLGNVGNDNHPPGAGTLSPIEMVTDGDGKARVTLTVGMAPGDNYRVAASLDNAKLQEPYLTQTMADTDAPPPGVVFSPMLTVWRKLHLELDSMEAVLTSGAEQNQLVGTAVSYAYNSDTNETTVRLGKDLEDCWEEDKASHFENGSYTPNGGSSYTPLRTVSHYGDDDIVVQGNCSLASKSYVLRDDDSFTLLPSLPDTGLLNSIFDDCYILCVADAPGSNSDVPFKRNLGGETTSASELLSVADMGSAPYEADDYWVVYVLSAFQIGYANDRDPDVEGGGAGATEEDTYQASVILLEQIRDAAAYVAGVDATVLEQQTVVHEIGHQILESGVHTSGTIMNVALPVQPSQCKFSDADIHSIRNQSSSPGN